MQVQRGLWIAASFSILLAQSAWAEPQSGATIQPGAMETVESIEEREIAQGTLAEITAIRIDQTAAGAQLVIETASGSTLSPTTSTEGNALILEIPNAVLALPDGSEFQAVSPGEGLAYISVTALDERTVRISVTGIEAAPAVNLSSEAGRLSIGLAAGTATVQAEDAAPLRVVVTATRTEEDPLDIPRSVTVITREEIEAQTALSRDLQDILAFTVPGFGPPSGRAFSDTSNSFRGRAPLVLIDGVPQTTNASSFFGRELRTIAPSAVERIEVVRGPSAVYGQGATGGVINIITRQADQPGRSATVEGGVSAALGSLPEESLGNYFGAGFSGNDADSDLALNFSREYTGADFDAEGDRIPTVQGTSESETFNLYGRLGWDLNSRERLQLSANYYDTSRDTDAISDPDITAMPGLQKPQARVFEDGIEFIGADPQMDRNALFSLSYANENFWGSQLQGQLYYRDNEVQSDPRDRRLRNQGIFQGRLELENWGTRLQVDSPLAESLSLLWGVDYSQEHTSSTRNLFDPNVFDASGGRVYQKIDEVIVVPPYELDSLGLFAQAQWDISDRVALQGGLRYENFSVSVDDYTTLFGDDIQGGSQRFDDVVFNLGGLYRVTDELGLFASFAQGYSVPSFADVLFAPSEGFRFDEGIEDLQPQKVDNFELGLRGEWDTVQASLAGFYNQSNLGSAFVDTDGDNFFELERAPERVYGVEATVDWQPGRNWRLGSTLSWAEGEADFADDDEGFLPFSGFDISPLKLTAYLENQTTPGWRNRLQLLYVGSRDRAFEAGIDSAPISSYAVLNYISSIQVGPGELQIGILNLLDNQYFTAYDQLFRVDGPFENFGTAAPGRTVTVGYRATF
ncbi:TonB-dependent receptor [Romeria aff. gracilis LEGE 07310]|uniref:TonB-dependent receptor n=1 Tax=Vasconcelosia minhoensis LEGE 07310 TaxID=915328 RepID=A0A8J7A8F4_9CYAN|nr:TonB-dependent receptor [Romeria gracilis]MBE9075866.1 TonB-dependent receptor [Romeria aff. gracilis LEGE 07310]